MVQQRTEDWIKSRLGCVTASRISDLMTKTKSSYAACRKNYMAQLICERLTGEPTESFTSAAMQRGIDSEPVAREMYQLREFDVHIQEVGFILHPTIPRLGASPDGLVDDDGLIEIKCPNTWTHLEFLKSGQPKRQYILQMQTQMLCTGRNWCDFISFDDRLPPNLSYKCLRIYQDDQLATEIETEVIQFLRELDSEMESIKNYQE